MVMMMPPLAHRLLQPRRQRNLAKENAERRKVLDLLTYCVWDLSLTEKLRRRRFVGVFVAVFVWVVLCCFPVCCCKFTVMNYSLR